MGTALAFALSSGTLPLEFSQVTRREVSETASVGLVGNFKGGLSHPAGLEMPDLYRGLISPWNGHRRG